MKIDKFTPLNPGSQLQQNKATGTDRAEQAPAGETPSVLTHRNPAVGDTSRDIDTARVDEIRQAISEGRLDIRADKVADSLIASVRDLLDRESP